MRTKKGYTQQEDDFSYQKERGHRLKGKIPLLVTLGLIVILLACGGGVFFYITKNYKIQTIYVEGTTHYTSEEIIDMVMDGPYAYNSLFLSWKYRNRTIDDVPFVQTMDVNVESKNTVRITVYEKAIAGCVKYLGRYIYFDKDGIVVETSEQETLGIPQVTGLSFDSVVLYEPLPVEDPEIFQDVLKITQQLSKYSLTADKIYFADSDDVTLLFGDVRVSMGNPSDIDEKIMALKEILPSVAGESGVIDLSSYTDDVKTITFAPD